jgi:hypothetical protein
LNSSGVPISIHLEPGARDTKKLTGKAFAKVLDGRGLLLLSNLFVFLFIRGGLQPLPWQATPQKVHENMPKRLQVVASRLFSTEMGIDTHVTCCPRQGFSLAVRNVLLGFGISVLLGHAKIDHVDDIGSFGTRSPDQKVIWLDVAVNQVLLVDGLHSRQL